MAGALGEDRQGAAAFDDHPRRRHRLVVGFAAADREGAEPVEEPGLQGVAEKLLLGDVVHRPSPGQAGADHEGVEEGPVVGGDDHPALQPGVLAAGPAEPEVDEEEGDEQRPGGDVEGPVDAVLARVGVVAGELLGGH